MLLGESGVRMCGEQAWESGVSSRLESYRGDRWCRSSMRDEYAVVDSGVASGTLVKQLFVLVGPRSADAVWLLDMSLGPQGSRPTLLVL